MDWHNICLTLSMRHLTAFALTLTLGVFGSSCVDSSEPTLDECVDAKCDGPTTFKGQIKGRKDAIAVFLQKSKVSPQGLLTSDYNQILTAITKQQGCDVASTHTYVVSDNLISGNAAEPRIVSTSCSTDLDKGSEFYISLVNIGDPRTIEMFAWDPEARKYNFYDVKKDGTAAMKIDPAPKRCMGCHLNAGDSDTSGMVMTPIMNEMTKPWPHWNAAPGFVSRNYNVSAAAQQTETWKKSVLPFLASASNFEQLIREGQRKAMAQRVKLRRDALDLNKAMSLLRPLFCSEQVNYVTEELGSISNAAVIDPGLRSTMLQFRPDNWQSSWINDTTVSFPAGPKELFQVPIRGNSDVAAELALISTGTLTAQQVLQVRALDWQNPVFSQYRCGLWTTAKLRYMTKKPTLTGTTIEEALPTLLDDVLSIDGTSISQSDNKVLSIGQATAANIAALKTALSHNSVGTDCGTNGNVACIVTPDELAPIIDGYIKTITRDALIKARDSRICKIIELVTPVDKVVFPVGPVERFAAHPSLPKVTCR
jgi:hypothetical protein